MNYKGAACLRFKYHMFGSNMDGSPKAYLAVYIDKNDPLASFQGQQQKKSSDPFRKADINFQLEKSDTVT